MPDFATFDDLRRIARGIDTRQILAEASRTRSGKTVFLSHSSKDIDLVPAVVQILENHGGRVYVDLSDNRLPKEPSSETGQILRDTIGSCRKLVALVTTASKDSRWIPWELGLGDGQKSDRHVCLFPSAEKVYEESWAGQEYLGLYERIVWGRLQGYDDSVWMVYNHHTNTATELGRWLSS